MDSKQKLRGRVAAPAVLACLVLMTLAAGAVSVSAATASAPEAQQQTTEAGASEVRWDLAAAIALCVGIPALAGGYAVARVGSAALGAASEQPELLTRSLVFVALGEGIAIFGAVLGLLVLVFKF